MTSGFPTQKQHLPFDDTGTLDLRVASLYDVGAPAAGDCVDITITRRVTADADFDKASSIVELRTDRLQIEIN